MATKIRLARAGSKKRPYYHVVVADSRAPRDGRFIEKVGAYNPLLPKDSSDRVKLQADRIEHWIGQGAVPTDRVLSFINKANIVQDASVVKKLTARNEKIIELKREEIAARKKAEEEARKQKEAEEAAAAKEAEEAAAAEAAAQAASEEAAPAEETAEAPAEEAAEEPKAEAEAPQEEAAAEEAPAEEAPAEEASAESDEEKKSE